MEAERLRQKAKDTENWYLGMYFLNAVSVALANGFGKKGTHAEYMKEPIFTTAEKNKPDEEMTEEEIQRERDRFVNQMMTWQTAFELGKHGE